jgi:hypothetical protein
MYPRCGGRRVNLILEPPAIAADVPRRLERRRCIIPASGFFEETDEADGKPPHWFTAVDGSSIFAFAGLWDRWIDPASNEEILSCTVIVSGASAADSRIFPFPVGRELFPCCFSPGEATIEVLAIRHMALAPLFE